MVHRRIFKSVLNSVLVAAQNKITFSSKKYNSPKEDMILLYLMDFRNHTLAATSFGLLSYGGLQGGGVESLHVV